MLGKHRQPGFGLFALMVVGVLCVARLVLIEVPGLEKPLPPPRTNFNQTLFRQGHAPRFPTMTRGIVMCLHNGIAPLGVSFLHELRGLGNTLPVQIYHCLPNEMSAASRAWLLEADSLNRTEVIDVCTHLLANGILQDATEYQSYYVKVLALLHSSFDQVLLVDADAIFLQNPDVLWTTTAYQTTGTLFFLDRLIAFGDYFSAPVDDGADTILLHRLHTEFPYSRFGLQRPALSPEFEASDAWQGRTAHQQDSSALLFHKSKVGHVVLEVLWHLVHHVRHWDRFKIGEAQKGLSWGDKEYFWLACWLADVPHTFSPYAAAVVSEPADMTLHPETLCGSLAHYLPVLGPNAPLLYVNGKAIITPPTDGLLAVVWRESWETKEATLNARIPLHVSPRRRQRHFEANRDELDMTCLIGQGAVPIQVAHFQTHLTTRIHHTVVATRRLMDGDPPKRLK
ncbi:hypothetical protein ACHHYP_14514 [Achlya hypogyna]|uniref:Uncharacterized protein n=1 Tax=Achlya hypogyna TaxID=1202772 RepID=A0A1V9YD29_ACHHY|nr:hypothetical protein ACHHYP_14514 [Achlya hypogyna]